MKVSIEYKKATGGVRRGLDLCDQNGQRVITIFPGQTQEIDSPTELLSLCGYMDTTRPSTPVITRLLAYDQLKHIS